MDVEDAVEEVVEERLGYKLKKEQRDVIVSYIKGNDVFAILPTGFGKSLCYQALLLIFDCMSGEGS